MATTKTLTPTNQTITIDAFQGEKPDHRHVADAETKLADAVNALNSQLAVAAVTFTSYDALKSGIQTKAGTMASGSIASFDFRANFSTTAELPNAYYTCIIRKYDNNSYLADIISNTGADYKLSYAGNAWKLTSLSNQIAGTYGNLVTNLDYQKTGNVVTIYANGVTISTASAWADLATLPSEIQGNRYTAHFKSMDGTEIQISGDKIRYRGASGSIWGAFTYIIR